MKILFLIIFFSSFAFSKMFFGIGGEYNFMFDRNSYYFYWNSGNKNVPIYMQEYKNFSPNFRIGEINDYRRVYFSFQYLKATGTTSTTSGQAIEAIEETANDPWTSYYPTNRNHIDLLVVKLSRDAILNVSKDFSFYTGLSLALADVRKSTDTYTHYAQLGYNEKHEYGRIMAGAGAQGGILYNISNNFDFELGFSYLFLAGYRHLGGLFTEKTKEGNSDYAKVYVLKSTNILTSFFSINYKF